MVGAADPSAAEVPGSRAATSPVPVSASEPGVADTARCHQPGFGMVTVATYETVASPGGRTGTAMTGLPTGVPSVPISWTSGWIEVSFRRPAGPDRAVS